MNRLLHAMIFHPDERPRGWIRSLVFAGSKTPRKSMRRVVFKKNGALRPEFAAWIEAEAKPDAPWVFVPTAAADNPTHRFQRMEEVIRPLEKTVTYWIRKDEPGTLLTPDAIRARLAGAGAGWLAVSIGHDDYVNVPGGVQVCIQREERAVVGAGGHYLNLHPWQPLPRLAHAGEDPDPLVDLVLDGEAAGTARMSDVTAALEAEAVAGRTVQTVIHHLMGHGSEAVADLVRRVSGGKCLLWLHDFFTLCTSFALQRNDMAFCNAPSVSSNACSFCLYGDERSSQMVRMRAFFDALEVQVVAPSQVTLEFWKNRAGDLPVSGGVVQPHAWLDWADKADGKTATGPVVVAFTGTAAPHKGWPLFQRAVRQLKADKGLKFRVFGSADPKLAGARWIDVNTRAQAPNAMTRALAKEGVDLVIHWPRWPETFSLTTYEAFAGGAYVVTNAISGNVAAVVRETGRGVILEDEADLFAFLTDGRAAALAEQARADRAERTATTRLSDVSLPLLSAGGATA